LSYTYHNAEIETPVLNALNLDINPAESLAIIGQSGCGTADIKDIFGEELKA
jgi:ABC-type bacteriocin/lantibiotic exporter with double-glycine peptidase domain